MAREHFRPRLIALVAFCAATSATLADGVRMPSGVEIRGRLVSSPGGAEVTVETPGGLRVTIDRDDAESIRRRTALQEKYVTLAREVADTVKAREALVEWCKQNRNPEGRLEQYAHIIELDSQHEAANRALGNIQRDGLWMTQAAASKEEGLVQFGDRWVSPEEAALLEQQDELDAARLAWFPKVEAIERKLDASDPALAAEGLAELRTIDDVDAAPALVRRLGDDPRTPLRLEIVEALGRMAHYHVVRNLVRFAVYDADATVRQRALDAFPIELHLTAADEFVKLLKDRDNVIVNRAGEALQAVGSKDAVPHLITSLNTTHQRTVRVLDTSPHYTVSNGQIGMVQGPQSQLPPEVLNGLRSGAYPFGVKVVPPDSAFVTKTVKVRVANKPVLEALVAITQQNFGYDEKQWLRWWRSEGRFASG